jgi:hypothetical protein
MIKIFEFFYYSLYKVFKLVKRVDVKDENLASSFYAILLATNTGMILFILKYIVPMGLLNQFTFGIIIKLIFVSTFFFWYFLCNYYFLKIKNYKKVIIYYEKKYKDKYVFINNIH